ncbi:MAG: hypothetical protein ACJ06V_00425 [Verrucomicrobiota bacterium]
MSELTLLAQDITKTDTDRSNYSVEFTQFQNYISDIGTKDFNSVSLFASAGNEVKIDSGNRPGQRVRRRHLRDLHHHQRHLRAEQHPDCSSIDHLNLVLK